MHARLVLEPTRHLLLGGKHGHSRKIPRSFRHAAPFRACSIYSFFRLKGTHNESHPILDTNSSSRNPNSSLSVDVNESWLRIMKYKRASTPTSVSHLLGFTMTGPFYRAHHMSVCLLYHINRDSVNFIPLL